MKVEKGTRWGALPDREFMVIGIFEDQDHTWVHYREDPKKYKSNGEYKEYSCYLESFVERFRPLVD
jgi:hypothetical protein